MAGVDVDTSVVKPVIGMNSRNGRKTLLLRLPGRGLERARKLEERHPLPEPFVPKYKDHSLVCVIGRTLEGQGIPQEELCTPWKFIDLKRKKRKKTPEGDCAEGGSTKKKSKTSGQSRPTKVSFTFTFKPPKESTAHNSGAQSQKSLESGLKTGNSPRELPKKPNATDSVQQSHIDHATTPPESSDRKMVDHSTQADLDRGNMRTERGVQCTGVPSPKGKTTNSSGPSSCTTPSLENSLADLHQCLANVDSGKQKDSKQLWKEGKILQEQSVKKCEEENAVSRESMSMKVQAGMKYMEAAIHSSNKISQDVMLRAGNLLYSHAKKYAEKVDADEFSRTCFATLAQRLGVCAHMKYCQLAEKLDTKAQSLIQQAFEMTASTTRQLADLRKQVKPLTPCENSIVMLIESLLMNSGLGPIEQHLFIARKVIDKLKERE